MAAVFSSLLVSLMAARGSRECAPQMSHLEEFARELIAQAARLRDRAPPPAEQKMHGAIMNAQEDPHAAAWLREVRAKLRLMEMTLSREKRRLKQARRWLREVKMRVRKIKRSMGPVRHLLAGCE